MSQAWSDPYGLADYLREEGRLTASEQELVLETSREMQDPVRHVLVAFGFLTREEVYRALADKWNLRYLDLESTDVDSSVARRFPVKEALRSSILPFRREGDTLHVATIRPPDDSLKERLRQLYEVERVVPYISQRWELDIVLSRTFSAEIHREAVRGQWERAPEESAYTVFTRRQFAALAGGVLLSLIAVYLRPQPVLIAANVLVSLFFIGQVAFKVWVCLGAGLGDVARADVEKEAHQLRAEDCPPYTILVPLYGEANVVEDLIAGLLQLDYPKTQLEILVLLEEEDEETIQAVRAADVPDYVRPIVVPKGTPQTKPRACNVGLWFSEGKYLVIYDAEDRPESDQLRKAVALFNKSGPKLACVQCALNYYNTNENYLTKMFTLEYTYWFDYLLPGLMTMNLPIPLGGTSNHFQAEVLEKVGGWDPFNVTEDADLGLRIAEYDYEVKVLRSTTYEEANKALGNWIRQRSRWLKGYMQTALVHTRHPIELVRKVGLYQTAGFGMLVWGSAVATLLAPIMWFFFVLWILTQTQALDPYFPPPMLWVPLFGLLWGNMLSIYLNLMAALRRGLDHLTFYALTSPFYWLLMSVAAYKAFFQLFYKPFYWEKTSHGLTDHDFFTT